MQRASLCTLLTLSVCLAFSAQASAQGGLRFKAADPDQANAQTKPQQKAPRTLQLHYTGAPGSDEPIVGPSLSNSPSVKLDASNGSYVPPRNNTLWADWNPFDNGLLTSAGLMWRDASGSNRGVPIEAMPNDLDARYRVSTPFFGLGWRSEASRATPWRWSAEVGTYLTGKGDCSNSVVSCTVSSGMGLRPGASGDGIRWNSYFSLGASFQY